VANHHVDGFII